jgi:hypothetical protein
MMNSEASKPDGVSDKSPFAGCAILITALLVMLFLIVFSVVVLFRQFGEIAKFTEKKPVRVEIESLEDREAELNALAEKIERFRLAVMDGKSAVLELNAGEMNLAIAAYGAFKEMRGMMRVREITKEKLTFDISFKLNGRPRLAKEGESGIVGSDPRYLNGVLIAKPGLLDKEVVLQVTEIEVPFASVARGFVDQMSPYRITEKFVGDTEIGKVMSGLTNVELADGVVRFVKKEGELPKDTLTNEQVDQSSQRLFTFLGIAATVFLLFVAGVLFIGLRAKKRGGNSGGPDEPA